MKHFALWPLAQVAEACFGTDQWPGDLPVPQAWIEFDAGNIDKATAELKVQGYRLGLKGTAWAEAQVDTIRLKLLKIGAVIRLSVRRVLLQLSSAYPWKDLSPRAFHALRC